MSSDYISNKSPIKIRHNNTYCNNHEWETTPTVFLNSKYGCPICAYNGVSMTNSLNTKIFKDRVKNIIGNECFSGTGILFWPSYAFGRF